MTFYDVVLDYILLDAFEDLENPPSTVKAVIQNRWLSVSFKETVCIHSLIQFIYVSLSIHVSLFFSAGIIHSGMVCSKSKTKVIEGNLIFLLIR